MTQAATTQTDAYIPGVCNINTKEIAYRRKVGYVGLVAFIVIFAVLLALDVNRYTRLILFVPAFLAITGFLQARNKFCVGYGAAGQHNANEGSDSATTIDDTAAVQKDKARARKMNTQVFIGAIAATLISLLVPSF